MLHSQLRNEVQGNCCRSARLDLVMCEFEHCKSPVLGGLITNCSVQSVVMFRLCCELASSDA